MGVSRRKLAVDPIELSVVIPCLDEADTIGRCIEKARVAMESDGIHGEIIVADNGSHDASRSIAEKLGARVVSVAAKGYGNALLGGIAAARGKYVLMGDADDSYDFGELARFVAALRGGCTIVQGCRLPSGGGRILPGAMPFLHRWLGNPFFSTLARVFFRVPIHDIYCGMRAFRRELVSQLDLRCTGMEFATEMIIKASLRREKFGEVPISLHPDGRKAHGSHLRTFRDGWRTLRLYLTCVPEWLFLSPGAPFRSTQFHEALVHRRRVTALLRHLVELVPKNARVLDIGAGDGRIAAQLRRARPDCRITAVDTHPRAKTFIPVQTYEGSRLPFDDESFDVALLIDVVHHASDPKGLLAEAARVTKSAVLLKDHLCESRRADLTLRFMDWVGNAGYGVALPYRYWSEKRWRETLAELGLSVDEWRTDLRLYPALARPFVEHGLQVLARLRKNGKVS